MSNSVWKHLIKDVTVLSFLFGFAMVPLPAFEGNPTGLKLLFEEYIEIHTRIMSDWSLEVSGNDREYTDAHNAIKDAMWHVIVHGNKKPKKGDYEDRREFLDDVKYWRETDRSLDIELKRVKAKKDNLSQSYLQLVAKHP
jgi:hypothetical protein